MRYVRQIGIFGVLLLLSLSSFAQSVRSSLDSTEFFIGDQTRLMIELRVDREPGDISVLKNTLDSSSQIEFVRQSDLYKHPGSNSEIVYQRAFNIAFFDTGSYYIPAIPVILETGAIKDTLLTNPIPVTVSPIESDSDSMADIKPIVREPWKITDGWPLLLALAVIGVIAFFVWQNRKKRREEAIIPEVPPTPYELAMHDLEELEQRNLPGHRMVKEHFAHLSIILRTYIERTFIFPAMELTTSEIDYQLERKRFPGNMRSDIIEKLSHIDLVKYAKVRPGEEEISGALLSVKQLISGIQAWHTEQTTTEEE